MKQNTGTTASRPVFSMLWCLALMLLCHSTAARAQTREPIWPLPQQVTEDPQRAELGRQLFHDARLSRGDIGSCATCHPLDRAGVDGRARSPGFNGKKDLRNTPTMFNVRYNLYMNWDGAHESLLAHTEATMKNPALMNYSWDELVAKLNAIPVYYSDFKKAYPEGLTKATVLDAIVSFERTLVTPNARFDRYLRGEKNAMTADELRGYQLFKSNGCVTCHQGINIGGNLVQKFGVFAVPQTLMSTSLDTDPGRFRVTNDKRDQYVFRVPSLRNVAVTGPYFHDGQVESLERAVWLMARAQLGRSLNGEEVRLIAAFLRTLTGEWNGKVIELKPEETKK